MVELGEGGLRVDQDVLFPGFDQGIVADDLTDDVGLCAVVKVQVLGELGGERVGGLGLVDDPGDLAGQFIAFDFH